MRNLNEYATKCEKMLDTLSIPYQHGVTYTVNTRAKKRWGLCSFKNGNWEISINSNLLDERNDEKGLINTIIHEQLHTCPNCMEHKAHWLYYADKVNSKYDLGIKRCSSSAEKGINVDINPIKVNYIVKCEKCGHEFKKERFSKLIQHPECYRCNCGGKLTRIK